MYDLKHGKYKNIKKKCKQPIWCFETSCENIQIGRYKSDIVKEETEIKETMVDYRERKQLMWLENRRNETAEEGYEMDTN